MTISGRLLTHPPKYKTSPVQRDGICKAKHIATLLKNWIYNNHFTTFHFIYNFLFDAIAISCSNLVSRKARFKYKYRHFYYTFKIKSYKIYKYVFKICNTYPVSSLSYLLELAFSMDSENKN